MPVKCNAVWRDVSCSQVYLVRLNWGKKVLVCLLLNILEIPCGEVVLVCLSTGDVILSKGMLAPRFFKDHQYCVLLQLLSAI